MKILLGVILAAALAWSGYWYFGARTVENGLTDWLEQRQQDGWAVNADDVQTNGFPNRFDTTITNIDLADPETGVAWRAPFFQILALSYKPHHVIAVWPDRQTIATPYQTTSITSQDMRGSLVFAPGIDLLLDRATIELGATGLSSTSGWRASLASGQLALRQKPATTNTYDLAIEARDLKLPIAVSQSLSNKRLISDSVETLKLSATATFDAPWDRSAIEVRRPQPTRIDLDLAQATWGELDLQAAGKVKLDKSGVLDGEITIKATNWREILQVARATGAIPDSVYSLLEKGLSTLARFSGNSKTIDVPLQFRNGKTTLGGVLPLGPAPQIILR